MDAPARILVIDDEPALLRVLRLALNGPDWKVETVATAEEALARAISVSYDLYILDKNLPGMSGIDFLREIRGRGDDASVILITGYASPGTAIEALNLGISAYLEKPFGDVFSVARTVDQALTWRQQQRQAARAAEDGRTPDQRARLRLLVMSQSGQTRALLCAALDRRDEVAEVDGRDALLTAVAINPPDVLVIEGDQTVASLIADVRAVQERVAYVVVSPRLSLSAIRRLIALDVKALVDCAAHEPAMPGRLTLAVEHCRRRKLDAGR